jgi:hypothetical protein
MIPNDSTGALQGSMGDLGYVIVQYVPALFAAVIFVIVGWILGVILYRIVDSACKVLRLDDVMKSAGLSDAAKEFGFKLNIGKFLGSLVMWFVVLSFLLAAFQVVGLTAVTIALEQVVLLYLPHVIQAVLVIILAAVVADFVKKFVAGSASAAGSRHGNFAGTVAQWAIWVFAVMTALLQLGIGTEFLQMLFAGFVLATSLACGLAFGLGGRDAAAKLIEKVKEDMAHDK